MARSARPKTTLDHVALAHDNLLRAQAALAEIDLRKLRGQPHTKEAIQLLRDNVDITLESSKDALFMVSDEKHVAA